MDVNLFNDGFKKKGSQKTNSNSNLQNTRTKEPKLVKKFKAEITDAIKKGSSSFSVGKGYNSMKKH